MQIVSIPNLPEKRVNTAIASISIPIHKRIDPIKISCLVPSMAKHADLQVCHLDGNTVIVCPEAFDYYQRILFPLGFTVLCGKTKIGRTYPQDAAYNIARVGRAAFHNTKITDPVALDYFVEHNIPVVHVKQGYTKCSVVPVCEEAIITADKGIAHAARSQPGRVPLWLSWRCCLSFRQKNHVFYRSCKKSSIQKGNICLFKKI